MKIFLNGRKMNTKEAAHSYLKEKLNFPDYYGNNLDALFDLLTTLVFQDIELKHAEAMEKALGSYGAKLISTFRDAEEECGHFRFTLQ